MDEQRRTLRACSPGKVHGCRRRAGRGQAARRALIPLLLLRKTPRRAQLAGHPLEKQSMPTVHGLLFAFHDAAPRRIHCPPGPFVVDPVISSSIQNPILSALSLAGLFSPGNAVCIVSRSCRQPRNPQFHASSSSSPANLTRRQVRRKAGGAGMQPWKCPSFTLWRTASLSCLAEASRGSHAC